MYCKLEAAMMPMICLYLLITGGHTDMDSRHPLDVWQWMCDQSLRGHAVS